MRMVSSRYIEATVKRPVHFYLRESAGRRLAVAGKPAAARPRDLRDAGSAWPSPLALLAGCAHIGVIQVLEENGIEVDAVGGLRRMGAYIAAVWGAGYDGREMEKFAREVEGYRGLWRLMDLAILPQRGFLLTKRVRKRLEQTIGALHFPTLARPMRVVATRLDTLEHAVFSGGSVVDAVLASIAIPGVCVPVTLDGISYIDGGICDPLPGGCAHRNGHQESHRGQYHRHPRGPPCLPARDGRIEPTEARPDSRLAQPLRQRQCL